MIRVIAVLCRSQLSGNLSRADRDDLGLRCGFNAILSDGRAATCRVDGAGPRRAASSMALRDRRADCKASLGGVSPSAKSLT